MTALHFAVSRKFTLTDINLTIGVINSKPLNFPTIQYTTEIPWYHGILRYPCKHQYHSVHNGIYTFLSFVNLAVIATYSAVHTFIIKS